MKKALVTLALIVLALISTLSLASAQTAAPPATDTYIVHFPNFDMYAPAKVVVTYTYSQNYALNVTDFGQTLHEETNNPTSMQFNTSAVDVYNLTFAVHYDVWVQQTVTIEIFEQGSGIAKTMELDMNSQGFLINMIISTSQAPSYPSQEQVVSGIVSGISGLFGNQITQLQNSNTSLVNNVAGAFVFFIALTAISLAISLACLFVLIRILRKKAAMDAFVQKIRPKEKA